MAELETLLNMKTASLQLWFALSLVLYGWPQIGQAQYQSPPEVTIPLKVSGMKSSGWLSYILYFGGQRHIIHLKTKKLVLSRHFSVFTYTEQGALLEEQPFVQEDCFYQGYVEGDPDSMVVLNTCFGGFQGILQINGMSYEIKPKIPSATFEHLVYKRERDELHSPAMRCALTDEEITQRLQLQESDDSMMRKSDSEGWWTHKYFIKVALCVDNGYFLYRESNTSEVIGDVFIIMNEANSIFSAAGVDLSLVGLYIWTMRNRITIRNIHTTLTEFCHFQIYELNLLVESDTAHLLTITDFALYKGKAEAASLCSLTSCGVEQIFKNDFLATAQTLVHMICHTMGMEHDTVGCSCGEADCLMSASRGNSTHFSDCSYDFITNFFLFNRCGRFPPPPSKIYHLTFCGNQVVDQGEECDCGSIKLCDEDPCCLANCSLKIGAKCATALCCQDCRFRPAGTLCREPINDCDLPEWCNGNTPNCPPDVHVLDGSMCSEATYCYNKQCNNRDQQCKQIFGRDAKNANELCYQNINSRGDRIGNCGFEPDGYRKCNSTDILCGRVQCDNVHELPKLEDHSSLHWTEVDNMTCWGTHIHFGVVIDDVGEIKDGTECGLEHMCLNRKCIPRSLQASDCTEEYCNKRGICNNKHHCHCNYGWAPPQCEEAGYGGSIDSGPAPKETFLSRLLKNKLFLLALFILLILLIICLVILIRKYRAGKKGGPPPKKGGKKK
ncbi:PREDICTED: disintegrin and metalloproteinase domain-containing protein 25-like [Dipodomys ordii]|uniref:Disintegrin and metalloproteinase domain-containing protein 25-like n=1 Tax=Dipodomys ordii TaxID=10020 RepID=A0A1S3FSW7_DIPOR|nr:PREDICTED: disintegrin and metalloproteinase domain-containing protein 25-like [Dipodomys ordii]